ncbi:M20/M25/M40 family metallo-hydrolase [Arthrobacter sp. Soil764]|uniref:M20/M25/M40 family metallo-hydrolase n=1 Tax=Arthrobacter sp. Soil764 TaxID=1736403 RepID=UPI000B0B8A59|nr:M20/M25/M40 family metallo-hydrolase [Arthrobacter sp. Soil764]
MEGEEHDDVGRLRAGVRSREAELERRLAEWVRVPGILGVPEHSQDLLRSANWLAGEFREVGFPVVEVLPTGESHAVYAEWCNDAGAPTVLVYSHHDVREVKPENWAMTAPFEPVLREGRLYGRGSSDAKGQILAHFEGLRAHLQETGTPKINLKFLIEGEEEGGSPHLAKAAGGQRRTVRRRPGPLFRHPPLARPAPGRLCQPARHAQRAPGGVRARAGRAQRRRVR